MSSFSDLSPQVRHVVAAVVITAVNAAVAFAFLKLGLGTPPQLPPPQPLVFLVGPGGPVPLAVPKPAE